MKIVNIDGENLHIFWTTGEILMTFSGKLWLIIILELKKKQDLILSLKDTFLEKPEEKCQTNPLHSPPPPASLLRIKTLT